MSANFGQSMSANLRQLQQQVTQLTAQLAEQRADYERRLAALGEELRLEKEAHAETRAQLLDSERTRDQALEDIQLGVNKYGRSWLYPVARQAWIDFFQSVDFDMAYMPKAYRMSCFDLNIYNSRRNRSPHALKYVGRDEAPEWQRGTIHDPEENFDMAQHFPFDRLIKEHPEIARKIAIMTMVKGRIIHCIARLDTTEAYPPVEGGLCSVAKVPVRFWWGPGKEVNINSAPKIKDALAPLHVCRDFAEIFGTAFFSQNKFSFASFGELYIFTRRSLRKAYVERMVNIEIWWQGSKGAHPIDWNPKTGDHYDRRTWPLAALIWMKRIKCLEIYVDESSKLARRRANEPDFVQLPLLEATGGQDNNRQLRDLRKLQGTDYVYQLRGMKRLRVYDTMAVNKRTGVRDESFVKDMRAQVTRAKNRRRARESAVENLKPMLRRGPEDLPYVRTPQVDWIVKSLFDSHLQWEPRVAEADAPIGGRGDGGDDGDDGDNNMGDGNAGDGRNRSNGSNGGRGNQGGDNGSDSDPDSDSDSDSDGDELFVRQPKSSGAQPQLGRSFQGRRAVGSDANGNPTSGFGNSNSQTSNGGASQLPVRQTRGTAVGPGIFDSDDSDDDLILDEERSAPRLWGEHIDLTITPDNSEDGPSNVAGASERDQSSQVKEESNDMDSDDAPARVLNDAEPASKNDAVKPDDDPADGAPASGPQPGSLDEANAENAAPKPDEDINMSDIHGGTLGPAGFDSMVDAPHELKVQAKDDQIPDVAMADAHDSSVVAQLPTPDRVTNANPGASKHEAIVIDDDDDGAVQVLPAGFAGVHVGDARIKIEIGDYLPDGDDELPPVQEVIARSFRDRSPRTSAQSSQAIVKAEESDPASSSAVQRAPHSMRGGEGMGREQTFDPFATPSSSRVAAEDAEFAQFDFPKSRSQSPDVNAVGEDTPRANTLRRESFASSSDDNSTVRSSTSSRKRSRSRGGSSTPRPVDIDQLASASRRSSESTRGGSEAVTRGLDDLNLTSGQHDGAGDSPPPKRRRRDADTKNRQKAAKALGAWRKTLPK